MSDEQARLLNCCIASMSFFVLSNWFAFGNSKQDVVNNR